MLKKLTIAILVFCLSLFIIAQAGGRKLTRSLEDNSRLPSPDIVYECGDSSQLVTPGGRESCVVTLDVNSVAITTGYLLIDLSNTTNYPHTNDGSVNVIDVLSLMVNASALSSFGGDIEIGYLTVADANGAIFHRVWGFPVTEDPNNTIVQNFTWGENYNFSPVILSTSYCLSYPYTDTTFQTDVALTQPNSGTAYPGNGDLVMKITRSAGTVSVTATVVYRTR